MAAAMAEAPDRSLPDRHESWSDLKAAYRFLNNPKVSPEGIQSTHRQQVCQLCSAHPVVPAVEDGSELDYTSHRSVEGLTARGESRMGTPETASSVPPRAAKSSKTDFCHGLLMCAGPTPQEE